MIDPYVDVWIDAVIARRDAAFEAELAKLGPLEDVLPEPDESS